ncbi:Uncharacterised protein [Chlamydia trachomatis]|nr:Uncharacterised protein [Chlamydia trachomatis]
MRNPLPIHLKRRNPLVNNIGKAIKPFKKRTLSIFMKRVLLFYAFFEDAANYISRIAANSNSFTRLGGAFPSVRFMICPTKKPKALAFPFL